MKIYIRLFILALLLVSTGGWSLANEMADGVAPDEALQRLVEGNQRFVLGDITHMHRTPGERTQLVHGQRPFAIILGCADSRVPPEIVFDQGLGSLFVVRSAGQVLDKPLLGSIEYAAEHLGSRLIVVMGHEKCGAVKATVDGGEAPGNIATLVEAIRPAVEAARNQKGDLLANAIRMNVQREKSELMSRSDIIAELVHKGQVKIVGAVYDLQTGRVLFSEDAVKPNTGSKKHPKK